jgi:transcriptional regulator with XRE-family HTH domain
VFLILHQQGFDAKQLSTRLGANLRRLRVASRLSLSELARATQISKATLSVIERGAANPTVQTLAALAGALGVSVGELLEEAPDGEVRIVRFERIDPQASQGPAVRALDLLPGDGQLEISELILSAAALQSMPARAVGSRVHLLVLTGKLIAGPRERISELSSGDWCSFPGEVEHLYEAGAEGARVLLITQRAK